MWEKVLFSILLTAYLERTADHPRPNPKHLDSLPFCYQGKPYLSPIRSSIERLLRESDTCWDAGPWGAMAAESHDVERRSPSLSDRLLGVMRRRLWGEDPISA